MTTRILTICTLFYFCFTTACSKSSDPSPGNTNDSATLIAGKWKLIKDSVYNNGSFFIDQGGTNYYPTSGVYYGTSNDYYDFQANGTLSVFENNQSYSSAYQVLPNGKLLVNELLVYDTATIVALNTVEAVFDWKASSAYGGQYYKRIYLRK